MNNRQHVIEQTIHTQINWLDRKNIISILEDHGYACYDHEDTEMLRECLRQDVESGEIDETELDVE